MATTNTWNQVVSKITGVVNRGTLNWSGSNTTYVLSSGYYTGGTLDSRPSYTNGYNTGVSAADNRVNTSSASYSSGYNNGYSAGNTAGYNNGYNAGVNAGKGALSIGVAWCNSTYGISGSLPGTILSTRTLGHNGLIVAISQIDVDYDCGVSINGGTPVIAHTNQYGGARIRVRANRVNSNTQFNVMNDYTEHYYSGTIIVLYIT